MEGGNWILLKEWKTCRDVVTDNAPQKTNISHCVEWDSKSYRFWKCRTWKYNHFRRWGKSLTITAGDNVNIYKKYNIYLITNGVKRVQERRLSLLGDLKDVSPEIFQILKEALLK